MASNIVEEFISILKENEEARQKLLEVLKPDEFVKKSELEQILEELRQSRIENNQKFEGMITTLDKKFNDLNQRFEKLIAENNKRFEQIDKRFEQMIAENNKRFEQIDKRFEQMIAENNKRFEQIDKRFEQMIAENNKRFEQIDKRFEQMLSVIHDEREVREYQFALIQGELLEFSGKYGKRAEDALRKVVAKILEAEGIDTVSIEHVQLVDEEGKYFVPGYTTDIDLYYKGKETWLLEYKARAKKDDIVKLVKLGELARNVYRFHNPVVVLVALKINQNLVEFAERNGIRVIIGKTANPKFLPPPPPSNDLYED